MLGALGRVENDTADIGYWEKVIPWTLNNDTAGFLGFKIMVHFFYGCYGLTHLWFIANAALWYLL